MVSLSLYPQFETNLTSNLKVIELLLQLKSAEGDGKNCIKVKPPLVRHLLRNCLLAILRIPMGDLVVYSSLQSQMLPPYVFVTYTYSMKQPDLYYFETIKMTS